jgi:hypothetical protein
MFFFPHVVMHLSQFFLSFLASREQCNMCQLQGGGASLETARHHRSSSLDDQYFTVNVTSYQFVWEAEFLFFPSFVEGIF